MVCSFCAGAVAFAQEIVVEVPAEQEVIEIEEIGLTLILPDSWKGKYAFEQDNDFKEYHVYNPAVREAMGGNRESLSSGGNLPVLGRISYLLDIREKACFFRAETL